MYITPILHPFSVVPLTPSISATMIMELAVQRWPQLNSTGNLIAVATQEEMVDILMNRTDSSSLCYFGAAGGTYIHVHYVHTCTAHTCTIHFVCVHTCTCIHVDTLVGLFMCAISRKVHIIIVIKYGLGLGLRLTHNNSYMVGYNCYTL